jgi:uncharacterized protein (UPF0332 family)
MNESDIHEIKWCLHQHRGIKLVEPNINMSKSYLEKAEESRQAMDVHLKEGLSNWVTISAYYTEYFAFYSLALRCGVKCEIHECMVALSETFVKAGIIPEDVHEELKKAKQNRINAQYYIKESLSKEKILEEVTEAKNFVLFIKEKLEEITEKDIKTVRTQLRSML